MTENDFPLTEYTQQGIQVVGKSANIHRGDGFDIGAEQQTNQGGYYPPSEDIQITEVIRNPKAIMQALGLSQEQSDNVIALITAGGAGAASKYLSKMFGPIIAGMLGAGLAAYVGQKLVKGNNIERKRRTIYDTGFSD